MTAIPATTTPDDPGPGWGTGQSPLAPRRRPSGRAQPAGRVCDPRGALLHLPAPGGVDRDRRRAGLVYGAIVWRAVTRRRPSGLLLLTAAVMTGRTLVALLTDSTFTLLPPADHQRRADRDGVPRDPRDVDDRWPRAWPATSTRWTTRLHLPADPPALLVPHPRLGPALPHARATATCGCSVPAARDLRARQGACRCCCSTVRRWRPRSPRPRSSPGAGTCSTRPARAGAARARARPRLSPGRLAPPADRVQLGQVGLVEPQPAGRGSPPGGRPSWCRGSAGCWASAGAATPARPTCVRAVAGGDGVDGAELQRAESRPAGRTAHGRCPGRRARR